MNSLERRSPALGLSSSRYFRPVKVSGKHISPKQESRKSNGEKRTYVEEPDWKLFTGNDILLDQLSDLLLVSRRQKILGIFTI